MVLAGKCLASRLRNDAWTGRAGISKDENASIIWILVRQMSDRAVVELYGLKWQ